MAGVKSTGLPTRKIEKGVEGTKERKAGTSLLGMRVVALGGPFFCQLTLNITVLHDIFNHGSTLIYHD